MTCSKMQEMFEGLTFVQLILVGCVFVHRKLIWLYLKSGELLKCVSQSYRWHYVYCCHMWVCRFALLFFLRMCGEILPMKTEKGPGLLIGCGCRPCVGVCCCYYGWSLGNWWFGRV